MTITWGIFLPCVVLLYYPAERIFPTGQKLRTYSQLSDPAQRHRHAWWRWQPVLWADALRAAAATWLLDFSIAPEAGESRALAVVLLGGLLLVGLIPQMLTRRKPDAMFAPVGYVLAVLFVLLPLSAALPAAVLGIVGLSAIRDFTAFFIGGSLMSVLLGYLLGGSLVTSCLVAAVFALPVVVSAMFRCKLVLPVRVGSVTIAVAPPR
jgi:hypothetical protein